MIDKDLSLHTYLFNQPYKSFKNLNSITDVQNTFDSVNKLSLCHGGPVLSQYSKISPRCAFKDTFSGRWRHTACSLTIEDGFICYQCSKLDETLFRHTQRQITRMENSKIHISNLLSPSKKKKLDLLREAKRKQNQNLRRTKKSLNKMKNNLTDLMNKVANIEESTLEEKLCDIIKDPVQVNFN